ISPGLTTLRVPASASDRQIVTIAFVRLACQPHGIDALRRDSSDHENRAVFSAPVVLLVRYPGPDHFAGVRCTVALRSVINSQMRNALRVDTDRLSTVSAPML